jgi:hypothetical protein
MKKFIFKTLIFLLVIWTPWALFINYGRFYYAPIDFHSWNYKHELIKRNSNQFNPSHIILGDSLAVAAINPTLIDSDFYNLAMSGSTPVDAWFYLNKYLKSGKNPKRAFLSFGVTHWQGSYTFREHSLGFGLMTMKEVHEFIDSSKDIPLFYSPEKTFEVFKDWFPFNYLWKHINENNQKTLAKIEALLIKIGITPFQLNHIRASLGEMFKIQNIEINEKTYLTMENTRGHHLFDTNETIRFENPLVQYSGWKIHPLNDYYIRKILTRLQQAKIKTVIDFIPNNINSWSKLSPEFFNEMNNYFLGLKEDFPEIQISTLEPLPEELFSDMDHVNLEGSIKYSLQFKEKYFSK